VELDKAQVAAKAVIGRVSVKVLREMQTKKKDSSPMCLFLLSNNVDLKNNNRKCRKPF